MTTDIRTRINWLYHGRGSAPRRFRYLILLFDVGVIAFFVLSSMIEASSSIRPWILVIDGMIAALLIMDFAARLWISRSSVRFLADPITIADIIVIGTLLVPFLIDNWAFLRVMRALRLLRSYHLLRDLRGRSGFFARNEEIISSSINLLVFIFVVTAFVYVMQGPVHSEINNYIDALYFTVTTLTTTGFGDITLEGTVGRLLAVVVMVVGVGLFLHLVQTIFRPTKVRFTCPDCGLNRHEPDAVHCKHCGRVIHIETEGDA